MIEYLAIARREVKRAVQRHPEWAHMWEDLIQDACEAMVKVAGKPGLTNPGGYARVRGRGAIVRSALGYLGYQPGKERANDVTPIFEGDEALNHMEGARTVHNFERAQALSVVHSTLSVRHQAVMIRYLDGNGGNIGSMVDAARRAA